MADTQDTRREHRRLTVGELEKEARARFGDDPMNWAFQCMVCGDIATAADFPPGKRERVGQECIGRHRAALATRDPDESGRSRALPDDRGCDFAAYGLIPGPWEIEMDGGGTVHMFALAPAPDTAVDATEAADRQAGRAAEGAHGDQAAELNADAAPQDAFAYWAVWTGEPLILKVLHDFATPLTEAHARAEIEKFDGDMPEDVPWTTGAPYLLEPLTAPRMRMLRRLARGTEPVTWAAAHGFSRAGDGVGCRHCGKDLLAHPGQAV